MNFYNELSAVESSLIDITLLTSNLNVLNAGFDSVSTEDAQNTLALISNNLDDSVKEINESFQILWDTIVYQGKEKYMSTLKTNDYCAPNESMLELQQLLNTWSNK